MKKKAILNKLKKKKDLSSHSGGQKDNREGCLL